MNQQNKKILRKVFVRSTFGFYESRKQIAEALVPWAKLNRGLNSFLYFFSILPAFFLYKANIGFKSIWYDEAVQFWISQGRDSFGLPFSSAGSMAEIAFYNRSINLDPGGYGFLLRLWTDLFGTSLGVLKSFSFVFFALSIVFIVKLTTEVLQNPIKKVIGVTAIMAIYYSLIPRSYAFEIRPYSMALFASTGIALSLFLYRRYPTMLSQWSLSIMLVFGIWARYNTYVFVFAAFAVLVMCLIFKSATFKSITLILLFPTISLLYIYVSTARFQIGKRPDYVTPLLLSKASRSEYFQILTNNLVYGFGLLLTVGIVFTILKGLVNKQSYFREKFRSNDVDVLNYWFLLSLVLSIVLSLTGYLPWYLSSRWSIDQYVLTAVAVLFALETSWSKILSTLGTVTIIAFLFFNSSVYSFKDRWLSTDGANPVEQNIEYFRNSGIVAIDIFNYPETIYLLESSGLYPEGTSILAKGNVVPYNFSSAIANNETLNLPLEVKTLIVSLNWSEDVDREIQNYLLKNGFRLDKIEPRKVGGLGYAVFSRL
jgi:hypothetical protein